MSLTDLKCKTAEIRDKNYRLYDTAGLYLEVTKAGRKYWRLKYRFNGKEKRLALGVYPPVSLKDARIARDEARIKLSKGIDPSVQKRAAGALAHDTFEAIGREWFERFKIEWSITYQKKMLSRLEKDAFPWLGKHSIGTITPRQVLDVIHRVEKRGAIDSAHRLRQLCSTIFRYAITTCRAQTDPAQTLVDALPAVQKEHHAAITDPIEFAQLLRVIDHYKGSFIVRCALMLAPLLFQRTKELRHMEWDEIDWNKQLWLIPKAKMKMGLDHIVPLSRQAIEIIQSLQPLTGNHKYVFSGERDPKNRCISENTIRGALIALGYNGDTHTGHGFRASARTMLDEQLHERVDHVEHQLAHQVKDPLGRAYNRTSFLEERKIMMQRWADYLDQLKKG